MRQSIAAVLVFLFLTGPVAVSAGEMYFYGGGTKSIEEILRENPLKPEENIKSTPLYRSPGLSAHLIQIRRAEAPHVHETHDLMVTVRRGSGKLHMNGETLTLNEGDTVLIPRGVRHFFENAGAEAAVGVGVFIPAYDGKDTVAVE